MRLSGCVLSSRGWSWIGTFWFSMSSGTRKEAGDLSTIHPHSRMTSLTQTNETTIMTRMTNNELIDESIVILQTMNAEDCAHAIEELRNELASSSSSYIARLIAMTLELERVKGIARDRLATIAELRRPISDFGMEDAFHAEVSDCGMEDELVEVDELSCQGMLDALESALSPAGNDGLYGAYLRGELD